MLDAHSSAEDAYLFKNRAESVQKDLEETGVLCALLLIESLGDVTFC